MPNEVAFIASTTVQPGSALGQPSELGRMSVQPYQRIRVLAYCASDSAAPAQITMTFDEGGGAAGSLDFYDLTQGSQITKVYEVPGTMLIISAAPLEAFPTYVGVYIWGYRFPGE